MNLKKLAFALLAGGIALSASAAPLTFEVKAPTWKKIAEPTTDGVNVRKTPSTTAPRLVYNEAKIVDYDLPVIYSAYWSATAPKGSVISCTFEGGPIVSESNGWYEILGAGPKRESNGWVSAKFVKVVTPTPIKFPNKLASQSFVWVTTEGDTANGVYGIYCDSNAMDGDVTFYVGRLVDGVVVCPYALYCQCESADNYKNDIVGSSSTYYTLRANPNLFTEYYEVDASKLSRNVLLDIVKKATAIKDAVVIYQDNDSFCAVGIR